MKNVIIFVIIALLLIASQFNSFTRLSKSDSVETTVYKLLALFLFSIILYVVLEKLLKSDSKKEDYKKMSELIRDEDFYDSTRYLSPEELNSYYENTVLERTGGLIASGSKEKLLAYPKGTCRRGRSPGYPYRLYVDWDKVY